MADFTAARETCRSWEEFLNETVEGTAHRLARRDFSLQVRPWCFTEELMKTSFDRNYELFANSWELREPLWDDKLHFQALERLSNLELEEL